MAFVKKQLGNNFHYKFSDDQSPEDKTQDPNAVITLGDPNGQPIFKESLSGQQISALIMNMPTVERLNNLVASTLNSLDKNTTPEQAAQAVEIVLKQNYGNFLNYINEDAFK